MKIDRALGCRALAFSVFATSFMLLTPGRAPAQAQGRSLLPDSVNPGVFQAAGTPKGRLPASQSLRLSLALPLRNQPQLNSLLDDIYNPSSPNYHHWLTSDEFVKSFGPSDQDVTSVVNFAKKYGFTVTDVHSNHQVVDVIGSVNAVSQAFNVTMLSYQHPTEPRSFFGPNRAPSVESGVPIKAIVGLDNFSIPHPAANLGPLNNNGWDFRDCYAPGVTLDGTGQSIGLFEFGVPSDPDFVSSFPTSVGGYPMNYRYELLDGVSAPVAGSEDGGGEEDLDLEAAYVMAPGATIVTYNGSNALDIWNKIASDNTCKTVSSSFNVSGSSSVYNSVFQQMAAQGQSVFQASGDGGYEGSSVFGWEDDPYITIVGGTIVSKNSNQTWQSEVGWSGSTGGISPNYSIPSWQQGISMSTNGGSTTKRNFPDVSMMANQGTSEAAPFWAAFVSLANQQAVAFNKPTVGFINPAVYSICKGSRYTTDFHDVTGLSGSNGAQCVAGYDLVTGIGSPAGQPLINDLTGVTVILNGTYILQDAAGYALDDAAGGGSGTGLIQWTANGALNQRWIIAQIGTGEYEILSANNGLAATGSTSNAQLTLQAFTGAANQLWTIQPNGSSYNLINVSTGQAMDDWGGGSGQTVGQWSASTGNGNQNWTLTPAGSGTIANGTYLFEDTGGFVLDDPQGGGAGSGLIQWSFNGGLNQQWAFTLVGSGQYEILSILNGLAVTGSTSSAQLTLQPFTASSNQLWTPTANGSYYNLINVGTGQAMDDWGGGSGVTVGQWASSTGNGNQNWCILVP